MSAAPPLMLLLYILLHLASFPAAGVLISKTPVSSPENSPIGWSSKYFGPVSSPLVSPRHYRPALRHHFPRHHHILPPAAAPAPSESLGCDDISCSYPLTSTPIGSPCGCVYPMQVEIDLGVAPYQLFSTIAQLEVDVAAGTFLKQSQVRIMSASASIRDPAKTTVTIDLVPLGEKFDKTTALLTYDRFWQKKVPINMTLFGDYDVLFVQYPGLPSSPQPLAPGAPTRSGTHQYPLIAVIPTGKKQRMNGKMIVIISLSSLVLVLICFVLIGLLLRMKKLGKTPTAVGSTLDSSITRKPGMRSMFTSSLASSISASFVTNMAASMPSVKTFLISELRKATDNFSSDKILGEGGFGRVYHGVMDDNSEVAIKLLRKENQNGDREFIAEVEMLSRLHHRNLVKLTGICMEGRIRCLVYELIRNGSVESHLHGIDKIKGLLDWEARMKTALGAARGLAYLHEDSNPRVIHRDFKASNVLLEDDFTPKVSDFGLAREASEGVDHISTQVMGTFGYVAPEYAMTGHLLVKSDVYSYGVVLLELLSGRKPVDLSQPQGSENLVTWARPLLTSREGLEQLIDPCLSGKYDFGNMAKVAAIASMCVQGEVSQRPFMGEVVQALKLICNDKDDNLDNSFSQREESLGTECNYTGDFDTDSCWWNGSTPRLTYGCASPFVTMEYSSGPTEVMQRPHSTSSLVGCLEYSTSLNRSAPLETKRKKRSSYRLRGSMSEHGHPSRRLDMEDPSI